MRRMVIIDTKGIDENMLLNKKERDILYDLLDSFTNVAIHDVIQESIKQLKAKLNYFTR